MRDSNSSRHGVIFTAGLVFMMVLLSTTIGGTNDLVVLDNLVASALLLVSPAPSIPGAAASYVEMERIVATHAVIVKHPKILKIALKNPKVRAIRWYKKNPDAALSRLENALEVKVIPKTNLIRISVRTEDVRSSVVLANAVAEAYVADVIEMSIVSNLECVKIVQRMMGDRQARINRLGKDKAGLRRVGTASGLSAEVAKLKNFDQRLSELGLIAARMLANRKVLRRQAQSGKLAQSPEVVKYLDADGRLNALRQSEVKLILEHDDALRQFGPAHRRVHTIKSRLASLRKIIAKRKKILIATKINSMIEFMEAQTAAIVAQQIHIQAERHKTSGVVKDMEAAMSRSKGLDRNETDLRKHLQRFQSRLVKYRIAMKTNPPVSIRIRAEVPEK